MPWENQRYRRSWRKSGTPFLGSFLLLLLAVAACAPLPPPEPPVRTPSKVITEDGMEFFVYGLKLPGTRQEFKLREGVSLFWVPLHIVQYLRLSGPEEDQYRRAEIILTTGEKLRGELFVDHLIEGTTDVGYWNIALKDVRQLGMGSE
jgi:hypothetical protein